MKVKNVGMKIIGNQSFRLLPGGTMEVTGKELWVTDYLDEGKLKVIEDDKREEPIPEANVGEISEEPILEANVEEISEEKKNEPDMESDSRNTEEPEKKAAGRRKNQKAE